MVRHKEKLDLGLFSWDRQHHRHHRVEGYRKTVAFFAVNRTFELAVEQVSDDGLIPKHMLVPCLQRPLLFVLMFFVVVFHIRLFAFSVQVLAKQVKNCVDALVGVMLRVTLELLRVLAKDSLKHVGTDTAAGKIPHFIQCLSICHDKPALSTERVFNLQICYELILAF